MGRIREWWGKVRAKCGEIWVTLRPGPEARRGAIIALFLAVLPYWWYFGGRTRFGLGLFFDSLLFLVLSALLLPLAGALIAGLLGLLAKLPRFATGVLIAGSAMLGLLWPTPLVGFLLAFLVAAIGATALGLWAGGAMSRGRRILTAGLLVLSIAALVAFGVFLQWRGDNEKLVTQKMTPLPAGQTRLTLPDPGAPGAYPVRYLTYGAGTDQRRPEFGGGAALKSRTVDGSKLLKDVEGFKGKVLKWYWGFGTDKMPLNARVWYPDADGRFPLVLIVHGNHHAQEASDPGYEYLGRHLASRGYILASIDENFINSGFPFGYDQKETAARGWLLLEHLKLWREWNAAAGHRFAGKVDMDRIALMGHSRGGEATATAFEFNRLHHFPGDATQAFDYGFHIRSLIAIAPADGQYRPAGQPRTLKDVSYFTIHGSHDYDVSSFVGANQFQRTTFSQGSPHFKAYLYIYRANHGQFNTVWGEQDGPIPGFWLLNVRQLITGEQQRQIGLVYFTAFLEATLRDKREYLPLFEDSRHGAQWLPETLYVNRFADASTKVVASFDEDYDVDSTTLPGGKFSGQNLAVWREQRIHFRRNERGDNGVYLGWRKDEKASYTLDLPTDLPALAADSTFEFAYADADEKPPDPKDKKDKDKDKDKDKNKKDDKKKDEAKPPIEFTVELTSASGAISRHLLKELGPVFPPLRVKYIKIQLPGWDGYGKDAEPILQRYAVPAPKDLRRVRFVFDQTPEGVIILDDLAVRGNIQWPAMLR